MAIETGKRQVLVDADLNFGSVAAQASAVLTVSVPGASVGDAVHVSAPRNVGAVASQGTLTLDTQPTDADTMTINGQVYTFDDVLTDTANRIFNGADLAAAKVNTVAAVNGAAGEGTLYGTGTVANAGVTIADFVGNNAVLTAKVPGAAGDSIDTTETFTPIGDVFDGATLGTTRAGADSQALIVDAWVSDTDEVTVRATNVSAGAIDADLATYRIICWLA